MNDTRKQKPTTTSYTGLRWTHCSYILSSDFQRNSPCRTSNYKIPKLQPTETHTSNISQIYELVRQTSQHTLQKPP